MELDLAEAFRNYRKKIVDQWVDYTLSTYKSSEFFKKERDKFANPTGMTIRNGLEELFGMFAAGTDPDEFKKPLENIMRLRAVQEFSPSQAVGPINAVKHITREILSSDKERAVFVKDLYDFEFAVDLAMLAAFDIYMESKERLYQLRVNELKSGRSILTDSKCPSKNLQSDLQDNIIKVKEN